jgi:3-hydroxybutyryl-CoA dehydrogenase
VSRVAVVGGGTMGNGIAQVFAAQGNDVVLVEVSAERVAAALGNIGKSLDRMVKKGTVTEADKAAALGRIRGVTAAAEVGQPDLVVEAVLEDAAVKRGVFQALDRVCPPATLFATNTSSISVTELAAATQRPDRFIGMHFMNPVPVLPLVEIVRGLATSDATYAAVEQHAKALGKTPVEVQDYPVSSPTACSCR